MNVRDDGDSFGVDDFEVFFKANWKKLLLYVRAESNNGHYAEDIVQEVMITLRRYWGRYRKPQTLMFKMARQELARWAKRAPGQYVPIHDLLDVADAAMARRPKTDPLAIVEERDGLIQLLQLLPTRQREVVTLIEIVDLDVLTVSEVLGISPSAVKTHHARGLENLRTADTGRLAKVKSSRKPTNIGESNMEGIPT